jgi:hypothetical protein
MARPRVLLVNPPLWNAYAPHLAVPLLTGVLRAQAWPTAGLDLSIETMDYLLSPQALRQVGDRLEARAASTSDRTEARCVERALVLLQGAVENVEAAKAVVRSLEGLGDADRFAWAQRILRNAMACVSASFDRLDFDLAANDLYYSARSTEAVLAATVDSERNVYRWAFERMGLEKTFADPSIGLIGISVSADTQLVAAMTYARIVREQRPDVPIVMGGNFATRIGIRWRERHPFFDLVDYVVLYEGEEALPRLCERSFEHDTVVPGLLEPDGDHVRVSESQPVDLDDLPPPAYDDLPLRKYFAPGPILPTYASRSCAWSCTFCSIPFASNKFRMRPGARIVDEMQHLADLHDTKFFYLVDEILTIRSLGDVSERLIAEEKDFYWYGETRFANGWTQALADQLYRSGCRRLSFGLESYNQRVLDLMQKGTHVRYIDDNVRFLLEAGIPIHLFAILGFPGETGPEAQRTIDYCRRVVRRSEAEFGVEHTTWAAAPFVLDLHSPVARAPQDFGIEILPLPEEEDLALTAQYRTGTGLDQEASWQLARGIAGAPDGVASDTFWFDLPVRHEIEERLFLRAAIGAPPERGLERPLVLWSVDQSSASALAPGATIRWSRRLPSSAGDVPGLTLYNPVTDAVFTIAGVPPAAIDVFTGSMPLAERAILVNEATALGLAEALHVLGSMGRHGFFGGQEQLPFAAEQAVFHPEHGITRSFDLERGRGSLRSEITGTEMSFGARTFGCFLLADDYGTTIFDTRASRIGVDPGSDLSGRLGELVRHGFLYAVPLVDDERPPVHAQVTGYGPLV